nr:uncharacterized protein LOC123003388 [Drosophila takahashii]
MSNALVRAGHGLTLAEKRIVMLAITAAEYAETFSVDARTAYEALQDAAKHLFDRKITFFEPAYTRAGKPLKPIRNDMRWFTTYKLQQANALRSAYSWRLLELLMHYRDSGIAEYTIEDFCASMDATEKQKADFNNIRRRIIEPAVKELIEKDGWLIQWTPIKAGRKVSRLRFEFRKNPQPDLFPPP